MSSCISNFKDAHLSATMVLVKNSHYVQVGSLVDSRNIRRKPKTFGPGLLSTLDARR